MVTTLKSPVPMQGFFIDSNLEIAYQNCRVETNHPTMRLTYGDGLLQTQQGSTSDGFKCLTITKRSTPMPINSTPAVWEKQVEEDKIDVVLAFKNIEGARTLQDELNELISQWSKEQSQVV